MATRTPDPARVEEARRLRAAGLPYPEIATRLGTSQATVRRWVDPDYAERQRAVARAWKQRNKGRCEDCGAPTDVSDGFAKAASRCQACSHAKQRAEARWTPEACVEAMHAWAAKHGRKPKPVDWSGAGPDHPGATTVVNALGWNECLRRAGLPVTHHSRTAQHVSNDDLAAFYALGFCAREIAEMLDVGSESNVWQRLKRHGVQLRTPAETRRLQRERQRPQNGGSPATEPVYRAA